MTDDLKTRLLATARDIGFDVWRERAVGWRKANGVKVNPTWVESVRRGFVQGAYDNEDGVKAALSGLTALHTINDKGNGE